MAAENNAEPAADEMRWWDLGEEWAEAIEKKEIAEEKILNGSLDEAEQLLTEADVLLDNLLAPELERGQFYMAMFALHRKRWNQSKNEMDKESACFYLDKALKLFHGHYPKMAERAAKEAALFGDEMGNTKVRNVAATILYKTYCKKEEGEN